MDIIKNIFAGHGDLIDLDLAFFKKIRGQRVMIFGKNNYPFNTGGNERLGTGRAGHVGDIRRSAIDGMAALGRLDQRIHLGMNGAHAMVIHDQTADIFAMLIAGNGTIVSGGDDVLGLDQNTSTMHARASGTLGAGFQEFTAPVDSSVKSLQFTVFAECVKTIGVTSPSGAEAEGTKLSSGRIVVVDAPEPGVWRVKLSGTGYFSAIAQGKSDISFAPQQVVAPKSGQEQSLIAYLSGPVATAAFRILARNGAVLNTVSMTQASSEFAGSFTPPAEPFRIAVEGTDTQGAAYRRVYAPLLEAKP